MRCTCVRLTVLTALLAGWAAPAAFAQGVEPEPFRFGLVGLARLQTARLNVVIPPPDDQPIPADSCPITLGFVNAAGNPFLNAAGVPISAQFDLVPGSSASLDLPAADAFRGVTGLRVAVRPTVGSLPPDPCTGLVPTLEIFDQLTSRTQVALYPFGVPPRDVNAPDPTGP